MSGYVVSDGDVVADMCRAGLVGDMYTTAILNVGAVANGDRSYIATNYCVEPY